MCLSLVVDLPTWEMYRGEDSHMGFLLTSWSRLLSLAWERGNPILPSDHAVLSHLSQMSSLGKRGKAFVREYFSYLT
jgi:hypothetical protein